jgi:pimeloyl-ACP methyl ester carboxylesterase
MTLYTWLKFGHLIGLVLLSGGMATQLIAYAGLLRAGTVGELRTWQKLPKERLTDGGMGLLILTGLAMAGQSWSFTDGWILAAIGVLAVTIAAAVAGVGPRNTRLKAALAAAGDGAAAAPAELTATARDPVLHGAMRLQLVALVEIVYLMVRKPSGVGILVSLLVAAVAVVAVCWPLVGGRQAAAGSPHLGRARRRRRRIIASTILLAVVGLLLGNAAMVDRQDADATRNSTLPLDGGNIYVRQNGPRDAPALVLLHGLGSSTRWWDRVVPMLARSHHVIRIDLLGHGRSAKPAGGGYAIPQQGRRVGQALDRLGVKHTIVVGHSTGGAVATALAEQRGDLVTALALIDTGPRTDAFISQGLVGRLIEVPVVGQLLWRLRTDGLLRKGMSTAFIPSFQIPQQLVDDARGVTYHALTAASRATHDYLQSSVRSRTGSRPSANHCW